MLSKVTHYWMIKNGKEEKKKMLVNLKQLL